MRLRRTAMIGSHGSVNHRFSPPSPPYKLENICLFFSQFLRRVKTFKRFSAIRFQTMFKGYFAAPKSVSNDIILRSKRVIRIFYGSLYGILKKRNPNDPFLESLESFCSVMCFKFAYEWQFQDHTQEQFRHTEVGI